MYVHSLHVYDLRSIEKAEVTTLAYPGRDFRGDAPPPELQNVNLLLGGNGAGKTTVLRALALATLSPVLIESGFRPYYLVRRPSPDAPAKEALIKAKALLHPQDAAAGARGKLEDLLTRLRPLPRSNADKFITRRVPRSVIADLYNERSPSFFVVGYGATRRVESGEFDPGSARKSRSLRFQRVASLFEDHIALVPLSYWFARYDLPRSRLNEVRRILNDVLPAEVRFTGRIARDDLVFERDGVQVPFGALSDGYRAFIGWIGDLLGHMSACCPTRTKLTDMTGLVLVDEIDLHLHPQWQRTVVPTLARILPKLQFVFSTHSAIVAGTLTRHNIHVMETGPRGTTTVRQYEERIQGLDAEEVLTSSYFNLDSTRSESFEDGLNQLSRRVWRGDRKAAVEYIDQLAETARARRGASTNGDAPKRGSGRSAARNKSGTSTRAKGKTTRSKK